MKVEQKFKGNYKEQKLVIQVRDVNFDFTKNRTHIIITNDNIEILNVYAEIFIVSRKQNAKNVLEIPFCGKNILIKIETNYEQNLEVFLIN